MESEGTISLTLGQRLKGFVSVTAVIIALTVMLILCASAWRGLKQYHAELKQFIGTVATAIVPYADDRDKLAKRVVKLEDEKRDKWIVDSKSTEDDILAAGDKIRLARAQQGSRDKVN